MPPPQRSSTWILTGMSGAGKATALAALESAGLRCMDNFPLELVGDLRVDGPAVVVVDARQQEAVAGLEGLGPPGGARVLFLDARDDVLVRRLADSVRPHPCQGAGRGLSAVIAERAALEPLRAAADVIIDTSESSVRDLGRRVVGAVAVGGASADAPVFGVTVSSFGFKYGAQTEADWVVDVRFLRNPFWEPALRSQTGLDPPVRDYIWKEPQAEQLVERLVGMFGWIIDEAVKHGRTRLHVALGCTGGRHRSVAVAEALAARLARDEVEVGIRHRDVMRPDPR